MLCSDNARDVSQSPEQLRKMIEGIIVVCTKEMAEPIAMFNIEAADQMYHQTNGFVYLWEDITHNAHEADPFGVICGAHESYEIAEVFDVWRTGGGRALQGGVSEKSERGVSWAIAQLLVSTPSSGKRSPGRGGKSQDGGTRGVTFHHFMNCCQESQGPTTA